ncbi:MAG: PAS-domain containing protein, partial [Alphaproteobacteria bacterium]
YGPGDVEELVRDRVETRRRGEVYQYQRLMPNGTIMAINREAMPGGGTVTTYTDITERKKAEEEIAEKSALLEKTFQNMSQGLSVFDADLRLVAYNERYVDMWRFPEGFIRLGMPFEEIARFKAERGHYGPGEVEELIKRPIEAMRQGKHWRDKCGAPSGAVFESHRDPMPGGGVINTFTDITERKRAEAALRAREARLSELQTELLNVSRQSAMGELSSALAHELNQPLAAIMNYVQASRRMIKKTGGVVSEKAYEMMDKALDQADRAGAIVRGLREIVEKGEAARAASDINKVVEEASALGLIGAARAGIRLDLELGNELPPVNINEIQIQQVVMNLVRNGVEAMAESEKRDLTIKTALDHEDAVEIAIGDTGPGLAEEVEERLFQPFVTTKAGGMGIGLSISHSIVEAHGGRLWATPAPDGGTVFHFTLPLAPNGAEDDDE